jgi:hypothetical protein
MKKLLITAALASTCMFAGAQDMMSKKGTPILPEAGDWSIGADATELIQYFGNIFTKDANTHSSLGPEMNQTLTGLYVKDENTAFRLKLRIGFGSQSTDNIVHETGNSDPDATTTDTRKISSMNFTIGGGIQKYRGKGRLKGIYGAELLLGIGSGKTTYTYGNDFNATTIGAGGPESTTDFDNGTSAPVSSRTTESKNGSSFMFGLDGFIGAEYFFAPKMSLSGEYTWGLMMNNTGEGESTTETSNGTDGSTTSTSTIGKSSSFGLDVTNIGSITLHFYF